MDRFTSPSATSTTSTTRPSLARMSVSSQGGSFRSRMGSVFSRKSSVASFKDVIPEGGSLVSSNREPYMPRYAAKGFLISTGGGCSSATTSPTSERSNSNSEPASPTS